jgi:hypothetical protein
MHVACGISKVPSGVDGRFGPCVPLAEPIILVEENLLDGVGRRNVAERDDAVWWSALRDANGRGLEKQGSPHDLSKIVRQQGLVVSKALRRIVEGGLDRGIPGIYRQKPDQGTSCWSCNSLTLPTFRLRVRF